MSRKQNILDLWKFVAFPTAEVSVLKLQEGTWQILIASVSVSHGQWGDILPGLHIAVEGALSGLGSHRQIDLYV